MASDTGAALSVAPVHDEHDRALASLVSAYIVSATLWLVFATAVGVLLSVKFVYPDVATSPWTDFGRLRPIHTNDVFYAWASPGMVGLALYIAARSSGTRLFSLALGWAGLALFNIAGSAARSPWSSASTTEASNIANGCGGSESFSPSHSWSPLSI